MRLKIAGSIFAAVAALVVVATSFAGDAVKSGLKVGESVGAFQVDDITGPNKGTSLCYRCMYGSNPVVCVFTRGTSAPVASLVKKIDAKIGENDRLKSFVVFLPKKGEKLNDQVRKLADDSGIKNVPLTIGESPNGPPDYEVAEGADVTVLMWTEGKIKVNRAYKGELSDKEIGAIVADIPSILSN